VRALLVDAYDSFVYILDQYLRELGIDTEVVRNDRVTAAGVEAADPDFLLLGPGPGHPADARYVPLIRTSAGRLPILGVCLGHQAVGLAYGGRATTARAPRHGKSSRVRHDAAGCFAGLSADLRVTRYHSLVVADDGLPAELAVTARADDDGHIMGLRHRRDAVESVQFHPESITTDHGMSLLSGFIAEHVTTTGRNHERDPHDHRPAAGRAAG